MCGFAGFFGFESDYSESGQRHELLKAMSEPLSRRGPDDEQFFDNGIMSFVFRRLSIVDLESGQQPIWNENRSKFISINGEIYNHKELRAQLKEPHQFRTRSDSEVVLHLYEEMGPKCLDFLIGMFAIVIYDKDRNELFIARDRMGIKPLYYCQLKDGLLFGSELKALLAFPQCPREIEFRSFGLGNSNHGSICGGKVSTFVKGVNFLPGGSYALLKPGQSLQEKPYWNIEDHFAHEGQTSKPAKFYIEEFARLIEDSVDKRLMSDVPVGTFLSGGLDSALVTAIASHKNPDIHCFHALEKTTFMCGDTDAACQLAKKLKINFHPVLFDSRQMLGDMNFRLKDFEYFIWMMDSPRFDIEWFLKHELHRHAKTKIPNLKVMLLGQGADEFAGGYSHTNGFVKNWDEYAKGVLKREGQYQFFEDNGIPNSMRGLFSEDYFLNSGSQETHFQYLAKARVQVLQSFNLWHEDRTSSIQSVESRVPFLDHRLVEFLVSIPGTFHKDFFWDKNIIREVAQRWIPPELARRKKIGFFHTRNQDSIWELKRKILQRIFPEYREKYLWTGKSIFSLEHIEKFFDLATLEDQSSWFAIDALTTFISHDVFKEICLAPRSDFLSVLTPPSPHHEAKEGEPEKIWKIKDWDLQEAAWKKAPVRWKETDCPMFVDGLQVVFHLPKALHFIEGGQEKLVIDLPEDSEKFLELIRLFASENYKPLNFRQLSKKLKIPLSKVREAIRFLGKMELLTVYREEEVRKSA